MTVPRFFLLLVACMTLAAQSAVAQSPCDPMVRLDVKDTSLAKTLTTLSREYGFEVSFPQGIDRSISVSDQLPLNRLVEKITKGTSVSLVYREVAGCAYPQLARVVVYPQGEQADTRLPAQTAELPAAPAAYTPREYIYIDNMEEYVEEVLLKKRRPEVAQMTPEQRAEYRQLKRKLKKTLRAKKKTGAAKKGKPAADADVVEGPAGTTEP